METVNKAKEQHNISTYHLVMQILSNQKKSTKSAILFLLTLSTISCSTNTPAQTSRPSSINSTQANTGTTSLCEGNQKCEQAKDILEKSVDKGVDLGKKVLDKGIEVTKDIYTYSKEKAKEIIDVNVFHIDVTVGGKDTLSIGKRHKIDALPTTITFNITLDEDISTSEVEKVTFRIEGMRWYFIGKKQPLETYEGGLGTTKITLKENYEKDNTHDEISPREFVITMTIHAKNGEVFSREVIIYK